MLPELLRIYPDGPIVEAFGSVESDVLFGRSNEITGFNGDTIARIVEILPPLQLKLSLRIQITNTNVNYDIPENQL